MAAKVGRGARMKGSNFERAIAKYLTDCTTIEFKRGLGQARRGGEEISDVYSDAFPLVHFELKRQVKCNIKAAMHQAVRDTITNKKIPIVITKDDDGETLVTMLIDDWSVLFKRMVDVYLEEKKEKN